MKSIHTFILLFSIFSLTYGQGITFFEGTWEEVLQEAQKQKKMVFIDCYTTWCGPCKSMAKNTFTKPEVGDFYNKNFINYKLDMEKEEGVKFEHKYPVSAYPTLYYINDKGDVVTKLVGGQQPDGLIKAGQKALVSDDRSGDYEEQYKSGDRSYELVYNYVDALSKVGKPSLAIANDYLISNPDITKEERLKFLFAASTEADSKIFEEVIANKEAIIALVGQEEFESRILSACKKTYEKSLEYEMESLMIDAIDKSKVAIKSDAQRDFEFESKMNFYKSFGKKEAYYTTIQDYVDRASGSPKLLAKLSLNTCLEFKEDKKKVKEAAKWAKTAYKQDDSEDVFHSYVRVLAYNSEYKKAISMIEDALKDVEKNKYNKINLERLKTQIEKDAKEN